VRSGPVAVVGLACRTPGAEDGEALWRLLCEGRLAVGTMPASRPGADSYQAALRRAGVPDDASRGGFLDKPYDFDGAHFGMTDEEVRFVDPQQRLALELVWSALEDACIPAHGLRGSRTGVFLALNNCDFDRLLNRDPAEVHPLSGTGGSYGVLAGRVSYAFDLRGPSLTLDTGCAGSLVAIAMAARALRAGDCDVAIAGGVNLILAPEKTVALWRGGMLGKRGRCRSFDARADGPARGEGGGIVILRRTHDALAAGDAVRATILGSAVNHNGLSNGLTAPSGRAQRDLLRRALADAAIEAEEVGYLEAHATGTELGDAIELGSAAAVLGARKGGTRWIGCAKANLGHLEAASGAIGFIKCVLAVERASVPPQPGFRTLNAKVRHGIPFSVPSVREKWEEPDRVAGVTALSFTGTNCHVLVGQGSPASDAPVRRPSDPDRSLLLLLSAHSSEALGVLATACAQRLAEGEVALDDFCASANEGRSWLRRRAAFVFETRAELLRQLDEFRSGRLVDGVYDGIRGNGARGRTALVFADELDPGSIDLSEVRARFRAVDAVVERGLARLSDPARTAVELRLHGGAATDVPPSARIRDAALAIHSIALAAFWREVGVEIDTVVCGAESAAAGALALDALSADEALALALEPAVSRAATSAAAAGALLVDRFGRTREAGERSRLLTSLHADGFRGFVAVGPPPLWATREVGASPPLVACWIQASRTAPTARSLLCEVAELWIRGAYPQLRALALGGRRGEAKPPLTPFRRNTHLPPAGRAS
jgi:acyl transferase domain-containing protein